ncbi:hypothetical protein [Herbiconiux sp. YIM B11900]|uniref:hypothetical protein n=1 Tax=Herbiconiux sp. YIM B11900 TaxID=3404131 RepID=UPI003F860D04
MSLAGNQAWAEAVADLTKSERDIAAEFGVARSTAHDWRVGKVGKRKPAAAPENVSDTLTGRAEVGSDGGEFTDVQTDKPVTDWTGIFERFNLDPAVFEIIDDTVRMSTWEQSKRLENGDRDTVQLFSYRARFRRRTQDAQEFATVLDRIRTFEFKPSVKAVQAASLVVMPSDLQVGKVDWNGGTAETSVQALESFARAAEFAREFRPAEICIVDAGDPIENIYNTSSQLGTNDRDLPAQVEVAHHIFLTGLEILSPLAPKVRYAAVSSNHGAQRLGPKAPAGDAHADYGLGIAKMIRRALQLNPAAFGHVEVQTPEPFMESLYFETSGSRIGVVHGHQAGSADKLGEWWKGQSHGRMPVAEARILLAGHFHSLRYYQSGDSRHVFVGPASDRGSSWFTNLRGEQAQSGMLMFTTADNEWDDLRVV